VEPADSRIILFIAIAFALFIAGRAFQRMVDQWRNWRKTVASIPGLRQTAFGGVRVMFKVGAVAAIVLFLVVQIGRYM
jgi:hypothetical protein